MKIPFLQFEPSLFDFIQQSPLSVRSKTWVVSKLDSPTFSFYFDTRKEIFTQFEAVDPNVLGNLDHFFWRSEVDVVILCRDVPIAMLQQLLTCSNRHIIWFIDDDIPSIGHDLSLPAPYRKKMHKWYRQAKPYLSRLCSDVWVSTKEIAKRYNLSESSVLPPLQLPKKSTPMVRCFYHATSSHQLEWAFVISLVREIQQIYSHTHFEFIGDHKLYKACKGIPRVTVLHPMKWNTYQGFIAMRNMDIGLCPLINSPFNLARSHTKWLDITRQNAIGIFSDIYPYAASIKSAQAGVVCSNTVDAWLKAFDQALTTNTIAMHERSIQLIDRLHSLA